MFDSKLLLLAFPCLLLSACGVESSPNAADVKVPHTTINSVCDIEGYDPIAKSLNENKLDKEVGYHVNTLSGAATVFKETVQPKEEYEKSQGLALLCEKDFSTIEVSCEGKIKVVKDEKTQELTRDQLVSLSPIYVTSAHFCNSFELKQDESLHIIADQMTLQNLTVTQGQGSVLSISAHDLLGGKHGLKQLIQEPGSAIMIHAYNLK